MSVKTPCQDERVMDLFTSDHADERREAADLCETCPRLIACFLDAERNRERHGIWGGEDFSKSNALVGRRAGKRRNMPEETVRDMHRRYKVGERSPAVVEGEREYHRRRAAIYRAAAKAAAA